MDAVATDLDHGQHVAPQRVADHAEPRCSDPDLSITGYGVKAFALSMVQAAVTLTDGQVPGRVVGDLVDLAHDMLTEPVHLLPHVPETLATLSSHRRLVLITKGDLVHQTRRLSKSILGSITV